MDTLRQIGAAIWPFINAFGLWMVESGIVGAAWKLYVYGSLVCCFGYYAIKFIRKI